MFYRLIATASIATLALVGCGGSGNIGQDRWDSATEADQQAICEGVSVFGEGWLRDVFQAQGVESGLNPSEIDAVVDYAIAQCNK